MRQVLGAGALGRPRGIGWRGRREGGLGCGIQVNPWLIHVNVWQKPLQYCKVISLQLTKINGKKKKLCKTRIDGSFFFVFCFFPFPLIISPGTIVATPPDPVSQGSQPFTSPPSWCGTSLLVVPPNPVFPSLVFSESRLPCVPTFRSLIPQPPWKETQSCDRVAAKERSAGGFQGRSCCPVLGAHGWRLSFLCVAGPLVWEGCAEVPQPLL